MLGIESGASRVVSLVLALPWSWGCGAVRPDFSLGLGRCVLHEGDSQFWSQFRGGAGMTPVRYRKPATGNAVD